MSELALLPSSEELEQLTADGNVTNWLDMLAELCADFGKIEPPLPASEVYLGDLDVT